MDLTGMFPVLSHKASASPACSRACCTWPRWARTRAREYSVAGFMVRWRLSSATRHASSEYSSAASQFPAQHSSSPKW